MNSLIILMHASSSSTSTSTPRDRNKSSGPWKVRPLTYDHPRDPVQQNRTGAHVARRQRAVERGSSVLIGAQATGVLETVHLGMEHRRTLLNPLVVAPPDDVAVDDEDRPDRYSTLGSAEDGFVDGGRTCARRTWIEASAHRVVAKCATRSGGLRCKPTRNRGYAMVFALFSPDDELTAILRIIAIVDLGAGCLLPVERHRQEGRGAGWDGRPGSGGLVLPWDVEHGLCRVLNRIHRTRLRGVAE